jgi:hypothetical protein
VQFSLVNFTAAAIQKRKKPYSAKTPCLATQASEAVKKLLVGLF